MLCIMAMSYSNRNPAIFSNLKDPGAHSIHMGMNYMVVIITQYSLQPRRICKVMPAFLRKYEYTTTHIPYFFIIIAKSSCVMHDEINLQFTVIEMTVIIHHI